MNCRQILLSTEPPEKPSKTYIYRVSHYLLSMYMSQTMLNTYVIPLNSSKIGVANLILLDEVMKVQSSGGAGKWQSWVLL